MITETLPAVPDISAGLASAEYPPEAIERWNTQSEIAMAKYACGELEPMDVDRYAKRWGITLD